MAAFKDAIDVHACRRLARAYGLDEAFVARASVELSGLELKARVAHVADALRERLDAHWPRAAQQLVAGAPPALETTDDLDHGFDWWCVVSVVERHGVDHPEASLRALRRLTACFSAEFAVRPFLREHPDLAWQAVALWVRDPNPHVRRLASEGTRPRLPWGGRLRHAPAIAVLDALVDDPERYVTRSVANHLGDLAKDDPALAVATAARWLERPTEERRWVVRHGLRHLVKLGHQDALALQGFEEPDLRELRFEVTDHVRFPGVVQCSLEATLPRSQALVIDAVVSFVTARGGTSDKTWKWTTREHPAGPLSLSKRFELQPVSTRRFHPGLHRVRLQVNGRVLAEGAFHLELP